MRRLAVLLILSQTSFGLAQNLDATTGLIKGPGLHAVKANCISCHSAQIIRQNRATKETWAEILVWMQEEQELWPLPEETKQTILDYLSTYYGPEKKGRRQALALKPIQSQTPKQEEKQ